MYIKIVYSNGYCGCDEEEYLEVANEKEALIALEDGVCNYGFFEPDSRFVDDYEISEEEYETAYEEYQNGCYENSYWEEITKEEYEENK